MDASDPPRASGAGRLIYGRFRASKKGYQNGTLKSNAHPWKIETTA